MNFVKCPHILLMEILVQNNKKNATSLFLISAKSSVKSIANKRQDLSCDIRDQFI